MWYFAWILGLGFATAFAVLNAMWIEFDDPDDGPPTDVPAKSGR